MGSNRVKILQYSNGTVKEERIKEINTNKIKQNLIIAFKIFLIPVTFIALIFLVAGIMWFLLFLCSISKILAIIATLIIVYLIILLLVIALNSGGD